MSERKWTPGPWEYKVRNHRQVLTEKQFICQVFPQRRNASANGHLIAAAPELYEALEALRNCIQETRGPDAYAAVEAADVALAKARGEAPQ